MLDVNIDRAGPVPLHDQVAAQIRRAIADGEAGPGERLPLAKDLAAVLGVNKTPSCAPCTSSEKKACWSSGADAASPWPAPPSAAPRRACSSIDSTPRSGGTAA
jgi:DNA-binding transcriptional MocR family regulator